MTTFADLSHYQPVDLDAYAAAGHDRVILKATEGTGFVDSAFAGRWRRAGDLGLARVAYHYARAKFNGATEFDHFYATVQAAGGLKARDRLCLDVEDTDTPGRAAANCREFTGRATARGITAGIVYTGNWYAKPNGVTAAVFPAGWRQLWLSHYDQTVPDANIIIPPGWTRAQLVARQYTYQARVPGVGDLCDYSRLLTDWLTTPQEDTLSAEDVKAINDHTDAQFTELQRQLVANLGPAAVNNPLSWLNAGIAARVTTNMRAQIAPLLDDESKLLAALADHGIPTGPGGASLDDIRAALRLALTDVRLTAGEAPAPAPGA